MNKKLMVVAVAGILALPLAANAGDGKSQVYGQVQIAVEQVNGDAYSKTTGVDGDARKASHIGIKGSMDTNLADFQAVYRIEAGMVIGAKAGLNQERDTWAGLSSKSMGTVRVGTMATPYKQSGKLADPMFSTSFEARSKALKLASGLHGGTGAESGRATQSVRYDTPSISGAKVSAQYMFDDAGKNSMAFGLHWNDKMYAAALDYVKLGVKDKTAMKVSGQAKMGPATVGLAYEIDDNGSVQTVTGGENQATVSATYKVGATVPGITVGYNSENIGFAVYVKQNLAKKMSAYAGYGMSGGDKDGTNGDSIMSVGMNYKF